MPSPHRDVLLELGVEDQPEIWNKFRIAGDLWGQYRTVINLTGSGSIDVHVEEAVAAWALGRRCADAGAWLDVGAGGGFPGLVWAILGVSPLVLVEPRRKRAAFLEMACLRIGRPDVEVCALRLEDLPPRDWALASARAVWEPSTWLSRARALGAGVSLVHDRDGGDDVYPGWKVVDRISHRGLRVQALFPV